MTADAFMDRHDAPPAGGAPLESGSAPFESGGAFGGREKTGPIDGHRDGGGPDQTWDDAGADDLPI